MSETSHTANDYWQIANSFATVKFPQGLFVKHFFQGMNLSELTYVDLVGKVMSPIKSMF